MENRQRPGEGGLPQPVQLKYHNRRVAVTKEIMFDAAHHLEMYEGKCSNIHGHTYRVTITFSGFLNEIGIVVDFFAIKKMLAELIMEKLDHRDLNAVLPGINPTVDNMVVWIWEQVENYLQREALICRGCRIEEIKLAETPTSWATAKRAWMTANV